MPTSTIMTVRMDPELLSALRERAAREGRTVSAEVVRLIRREVAPTPRQRAKRTPTMGMFADFEAPSLSELQQLRRRFSSRLSAAKARRSSP